MKTISLEEHRKNESFFVAEIADKFSNAMGLAQVIYEDYVCGKAEPDVSEWFSLERLFAALVSSLEVIEEMFEATNGGKPLIITQASELIQEEEALKKDLLRKEGVQ